MKRPMFIEVRGRKESWIFAFRGDPKHLAEWRADGIGVFEVSNAVPAWAEALGLSRLWCAAQDVWQWARLW